jgi:hypothetical protein
LPRIVRLERPVFATPQRRTEVGFFAGTGFVGFIVGGTAGFRIDGSKYCLLDIRFGVDKADTVCRAAQPVQIAVTRWFNQTLNIVAVFFVIDDHRRVHFIPVPGVVPVILEVAFHFPGIRIKSYSR